MCHPVIGLIGAFVTPLHRETFIFVFWYFVTGLGITAGYHRLWARRSYKASVLLQHYLAIAGAGAVEGSIKWRARGHRAHHLYTDTELDPYDAHKRKSSKIHLSSTCLMPLQSAS
jgi:stearoyl-CoA desaturase (delta-9 desaturase)